ncbi:MAG TPA: trimethylamine methyltransferase family protein [Terriglobia bacterium]|nr:trimethylamine methyltransferase family protein [Terriglobia bacterium]
MYQDLARLEEFASQIHEGSLSLLESPGVRIEHEFLVQMLLRNGAKGGSGASVVRFPRQMVEEYIKLCPRLCVLADQQGQPFCLTANGPQIFWSVPGISYYRHGEHRPFRSADMAEMARLLEQLDKVQVVFGMSMEDIPPPARDVMGLRVMAENCSKHIRVLCFSPQGAELLPKMRTVVGDYPWFSIGFTAHGPLRWTNLGLEIFKCTAGAGIPVSVNGEPMAGVSAPVTLAGAAAVGNAEILAGLIINQLLEPGRPCIYNLGLAHVFDMKTALAVTGGPENALLAQASAVMGRFYDLPSASWVSTESMCPDSQAALEKMFGFYTHMAGGVTCIWGVGQLESELTISPAQAVIDNEMISYALRFLRGIEVAPETLALDVVREVGVAGSFLEVAHTLEHFRSELFQPSLLFRNRRGIWEKKGNLRLDQKAEEVADQLIAKPRRTGLSDGQVQELDHMVSEFLLAIS